MSASTSTTIKNLHPEPAANTQCSVWMAAMEQKDGHWWYQLMDGSPVGSVFCWTPVPTAHLGGKVLYARLQSPSAQVFQRLGVEEATTIVRGEDWIAARVADGNTGNHTISLVPGPFILLERAIYTPEDWEHVYSQYQQGELSRPYWGVPATATTDNAQPPITM